MFYKFPIIKTLDDILPHIKDCESIKVHSKDDYQIVNYFVSDLQTFPRLDNPSSAYRRECRGLIFSKEGILLRRPFHKFFNLGEQEETLPNNVNFNIPYIILDKVDGSMVSPFVSFNEIRLGTKAGITDISIAAESFISRHPERRYMNLIHNLQVNRATPIFEYVSRKNQVVIRYPEEDLILVAIRNIDNGLYYSYESQDFLAVMYGISNVKKLHTEGESISSFIEKIRNREDIEGVVIRFSNGNMIKVKTEWYCQIHKAKEGIIHEKNIIELILNEQLDDVLAFLPQEDKDKLLDYQRGFILGLNQKKAYFKEIISQYSEMGIDKKYYSLNYGVHCSPLTNTIIFNCWNNPDKVDEYITFLVKKNLGSQTNVDKVRNLWGEDLIWN